MITGLLLTLALVGGAWYFMRGGSDKKPPAIGSRFLVFWMPVNYWAAQGEKRLCEYIDACAKEGVHFGIEMAGWADSNIFADESRIMETMRLYEVAVKRCRKRGIWMLNSILNNNSHLSKYGNKGYTFTSVWIHALRLLDCVKSLGPANQLIQPCAETQTGDGVKWEQTCLSTLAGWPLVYNGGSRPASSHGWPHFAFHPTSISQTVPKGGMAVSDCGTTILQLHANYDGPAHPDTLFAWARHCRACGAVLAADYAFKYQGKPDTDAIKALAKAAK